MADRSGILRRSLLLLARYGLGAVWIFHGLFSKVLLGIPRHQRIVGRILGDDLAAPATLAIGAGEILLGLWILSGKLRQGSAAAQTILLVAMNTLELLYAWDLLLSPVAMVFANLLLLALAWYGALAAAAPGEGP